MTIPLWTLLIAAALPFVWFTAGNIFRAREFGTLDNRHPRLQQAQQTGLGARACAASANSFEALAVYAPAVLVAHLVVPASAAAPTLAIAWVLLRVGHGLFYLANKSALRTVCFALATGCATALYLLGAHVP